MQSNSRQLLPAQEGGKASCHCCKAQGSPSIEGCGSASMVWFVTSPLLWALPLQQMLGSSNIACSVWNTHCQGKGCGAQSCGFLQGVLYLSGSVTCLCNLPALQGEVNVVSKAPGGWIIFHQGHGLWPVEFLFLLKWGDVLYEMLCPFTTVTVFLLRSGWQENLFAFDNISVLSSS